MEKLAGYIGGLFNRSYKELNGMFYIYLTDGDESRAICIYGRDESICVKNLLPGISREYAEYVAGVIGQIVHVDLEFEDGVPVFVFRADEESLSKVFDAIRRAFDLFVSERPSDAVSIFGGFKVVFLGMSYSILSSADAACDFFADKYCTLPSSDGWYSSYLGQDNIHAPLLAWRHGEKLLLYVPREDGSLSIYDVSELVSKIRELFKLTNSSLRITDDAQIFRMLPQIEEQLEIIESALEGATFPFSPIVVEHPDIEKIRELFDAVKSGIGLIRKAISLSRFLEQRLILRIVISIANRMLKGETGVLSIATRKVSRLGAGYAIYISKEEAKIVGLRDKVTVRVISAEGERPKIVIQ